MAQRLNIYAILLTGLLFPACTKFVQVDPPQSQLVTASVFDNNAAATAALLGIYSEMSSNESSNMAINLGLLSDELTNYSNSINYTQFYLNAMTASVGPGPWNNGYNYVYQANAIIEALTNSTALTPGVRRQLLGEAKFIRSFWFFYLTNFYGDIPLPLSTNYTLNATIPRTPRADIYTQIITDLKEAKTLLNPNYVDGGNTTVTTSDRTRPNKSAAAALLARTYLYTGDYVNAEAEVDSVISSPLYSILSDLNTVFLANSNEAIWQLGIPQPSGTNTSDAIGFILLAPPPSGNCCSISPQLLSSFEPGDARKLNWIDSIQTASPDMTFYYPYKYKVYDTTVVVEETVVFRLAEQYLIRAEARAKQGNTSGTITDLNMIRSRANLPAYSGATDQPSLLSATLHERQVELFTEWGHRWLDLIRTKSADSVMSVVTPIKGGVWNRDNHQLLFPIPQNDRNLDVNLTQNAGY